MATTVYLTNGTLFCHLCGEPIFEWDDDTLSWAVCPHVAFVYEWLPDGPDSFLHVRPDCAEEFLSHLLDSPEYQEYLADGHLPVSEHDRERFCSGDLREEDEASTLLAAWGWEHSSLSSTRTVVYCCDQAYAGLHVGITDE